MERATTMPEAIRELASSWPAAEQKWIAEFIGKIRADYSQVVRRAMLYGSKARGDWHGESDIDVLVIIPDERRGDAKAIEALSDELPGADECLPMVLARTESEWARLKQWGTAFQKAVETEGVSVL